MSFVLVRYVFNEQFTPPPTSSLYDWILTRVMSNQTRISRNHWLLSLLYQSAFPIALQYAKPQFLLNVQLLIRWEPRVKNKWLWKSLRLSQILLIIPICLYSLAKDTMLLLEHQQTHLVFREKQAHEGAKISLELNVVDHIKWGIYFCSTLYNWFLAIPRIATTGKNIRNHKAYI